MVDTTFDPQAYIQSKQPPGSLGQDQVAVDPLQISQFDPQSYIQAKQIANYQQNESEYGTTGEQFLSGLEGAGRSFSFGASDALEQQLQNILPENLGREFTAEAIRKRKETNPLSSGLGNILGGAALIGTTGGLGGPVKALGVTGQLAQALVYGGEGALFAAGDIGSDIALGDPNLNAQKIFTELGTGVLFGTGLGVLAKGVEALPALFRKIATPAKAETEALTGVEAPVTQILSTDKPSDSFEQMRKAVDDAKKYGNKANLSELEQKPVVQAAAERINPTMDFPVTDYQLNALDSQSNWDAYLRLHDLPGETGDLSRTYSLGQKKELIGKIDNWIKQIAPEHELTDSSLEAGSRAAKSLTDAIERNRDELGPLISELKATPIDEVNHYPGMIEYLTEGPHGNPKLAKMFNTQGDLVTLKQEWQPNMGIGQKTFSAIKDALEDLQRAPRDVEELFDIRNTLGDKLSSVDRSTSGVELTQAKAAMMDYIQDLIQKSFPDANSSVREIFARYAQNEQLAQTLEKRLGARIGEDNFRSLANGQPEEKILDKIFQNSETVSLVKDLLPKEQFNQIAADYLNVIKNKATKDGVFKAKEFSKDIKKSQFSLGQSLIDNPNFSNIQDALTVLRNFADITGNPSGTAKTLIGALADSGLNPAKVAKNLGEYAKELFQERQNQKQVRTNLQFNSSKATLLNQFKSLINNVTNEIADKSESLFSNPKVQNTTRGAVLAGIIHLTRKSYDEIATKLNTLASNPQTLIDHFSDSSHGIYHAAPNITQNIINTSMVATQFLHSKLPQSPGQMFLSPKFEPSDSQIQSFSRYYSAVNKPIDVLKQVKAGSVSNEAMEALQSVHPSLLQEMRSQVIKNMVPEQAMKLSYPRKLALAKFLGQALDASMTPQAIMINQASFNAPQLSQQSIPQQGRKITLGGLKQLNFASRTTPASAKTEPT